MSTDGFLRNPIAQKAKPLPVTEVWTLQARGRTWAGQLRCVGEQYGGAWEFILLRDGELSYSRRHQTHAAAAKEAEEQRMLVRVDRLTPVAGEPE